MMLLAICGSMLIFVGVRKSILIFTATVAVVAAPIIWKFWFARLPEKSRAHLSFTRQRPSRHWLQLHSIEDRRGFGQGAGKGFRKGTQSQLEFLPERHTDFIFSVLSEEHGFIGSATTLGLFIILYLMAVRIAIGARDKAGALIVVGVFSYLFWAVFVNMGMVIGILPIVGVPLPLLSYGGSSLLTTMTALGLISSVAYRRYLF